LLVPARFGGRQADFPAILDPGRELAGALALGMKIPRTAMV
jgi:hypothetical protein